MRNVVIAHTLKYLFNTCYIYTDFLQNTLIMVKKISWLVMVFLAIAVASYALAIVIVPGLRSEFVQNIYIETPFSATGHFIGGAVALATGGFQVNSRLRSKFINIHRWMGRLYVAGVFFGGISALILALHGSGGVAAQTGFGLLAICWILTTLLAFWHIRTGTIERHRKWMIRSYALTLAAVTLRFYLPAVQSAGVPFEAAYPTIAWFCWVPNILIADWFFLRR